LFVGNLPFDATEEGLRDMIEASAASSSSGGREGKAKPEPESDSDSDSDSDNEAGGEGEGEEKKKKKEEEKEKQANRGGKLSGLRKVRLGAFEDTGRCKGLVSCLLFHCVTSD